VKNFSSLKTEKSNLKIFSENEMPFATPRMKEMIFFHNHQSPKKQWPVFPFVPD